MGIIGGNMQKIKIPSKIIESIGYDVICQILEVKYKECVGIYSYKDVPEDIWYQLRSAYLPEIYIQYYIMGKYPENKT